MLPPTGYLPLIKDIYPLKSLNNAVSYLRQIYNPEVRGSRRRQANPLQNAPSVTNFNAISAELDILRTDLFERNYAING
jgi:hypothetical protein